MHESVRSGIQSLRPNQLRTCYHVSCVCVMAGRLKMEPPSLSPRRKRQTCRKRQTRQQALPCVVPVPFQCTKTPEVHELRSNDRLAVTPGTLCCVSLLCQILETLGLAPTRPEYPLPQHSSLEYLP